MKKSEDMAFEITSLLFDLASNDTVVISQKLANILDEFKVNTWNEAIEAAAEQAPVGCISEYEFDDEVILKLKK